MIGTHGESKTCTIGDLDLKLITRTRLRSTEPDANIKALVSRIDRAADLPLTRDEIRRQVPGDTDEDYRNLREESLDGVGLLCIYPISKDSTPRPPATPDGRQLRLPLEAVDHVIGVGLFFPDDKSNVAYRHKYITADMSGLILDTDEPDINQLDHEDERVGKAQEAEDKKQSKQGS